MRLRLLLVLITTSLLTAASAGAIVGGQADGTNHPNVGAVVVDVDGQKTVICSGVLISPTHFLTAAHCVFGLGAADVWVEFGSVFDNTSLVSASDLDVHPGFNISAANPNDLAVITLASAQAAAPADLPTLNQFGDRKELRGAQFTAVGYGEPNLGTRYNAVSTFKTLNSAWLRLSQNATKGEGGTCFGDSGGPNFFGAGASETDVVAALTNTGDAVCRSTNVVYRLDTPWARDFLDDFVALP